MNKALNIFRSGYLKTSHTPDMMVKICGHMVHALDITLETVKVEAFGALNPGDVALTLYPIEKDGEVRLDLGVEAMASVIERNHDSIRLAFRISTYPLSKLIVRCLAARQGLEPYHAKIGL